jgi:hypothetical protein
MTFILLHSLIAGSKQTHPEIHNLSIQCLQASITNYSFLKYLKKTQWGQYWTILIVWWGLPARGISWSTSCYSSQSFASRYIHRGGLLYLFTAKITRHNKVEYCRAYYSIHLIVTTVMSGWLRKFSSSQVWHHVVCETFMNISVKPFAEGKFLPEYNGIMCQTIVTLWSPLWDTHISHLDSSMLLIKDL